MSPEEKEAVRSKSPPATAPSSIIDAPKENTKSTYRPTSLLLDSESSDDDIFKLPPQVKPVAGKSSEPISRPSDGNSDNDELFKSVSKLPAARKIDPNPPASKPVTPAGSGGSNGQLSKPTSASSSGGRVKSHAKINTTMPASSDSDDGLFSAPTGQAIAANVRKAALPKSLLVESDSDDGKH